VQVLAAEGALLAILGVCGRSGGALLGGLAFCRRRLCRRLRHRFASAFASAFAAASATSTSAAAAAAAAAGSAAAGGPTVAAAPSGRDGPRISKIRIVVSVLSRLRRHRRRTRMGQLRGCRGFGYACGCDCGYTCGGRLGLDLRLHRCLV
jgi:hypothetical protein